MFGNKRKQSGQHDEGGGGYDIRNEKVKSTLLVDEVEVGGKKVRREVVVASYGQSGVPRLVTFHKWKADDGSEKFRVFSAKAQLVDGIIAAGQEAFVKLKEAVDAHNAAVKAAGGGTGPVSAKAVAAAEAMAASQKASAKAAAANALLAQLTEGKLSVADYTAALKQVNETFGA